MATKPFQTQTVQTNQSVVDDKLKPTAEMHILVGGPYTHSTTHNSPRHPSHA